MLRLEKAFADAGGTLLAGSDPTGIGGTVPGFSSKREFALLLEAGFTVPEAIQIMTLNGARYLGRDQEVGSLAVGKRADLVVIDGDLAAKPGAIEVMPLVFKGGVGVATKPIFERLKGVVGQW
jgi:enamidase